MYQEQVETETEEEDQNCNQFGSWEAKGTSAVAKLCHGGWYQQENHEPCARKLECYRETKSREASSTSSSKSRRSLPLMNPRKFSKEPVRIPGRAEPLTYAQSRAYELDMLEDENRRERGEEPPPPNFNKAYLRQLHDREAVQEAREEIAAELAAEEAARLAEEEGGYTATIRSRHRPRSRHSRRDGRPSLGQTLTPVFMPEEKSDLQSSLLRMLGNMLQAAFAAMAQQIVEMLRDVNLFPTWS